MRWRELRVALAALLLVAAAGTEPEAAHAPAADAEGALEVEVRKQALRICSDIRLAAMVERIRVTGHAGAFDRASATR